MEVEELPRHYGSTRVICSIGGTRIAGVSGGSVWPSLNIKGCGVESSRLKLAQFTARVPGYPCYDLADALP